MGFICPLICHFLRDHSWKRGLSWENYNAGGLKSSDVSLLPFRVAISGVHNERGVDI